VLVCGGRERTLLFRWSRQGVGGRILQLHKHRGLPNPRSEPGKVYRLGSVKRRWPVEGAFFFFFGFPCELILSQVPTAPLVIYAPIRWPPDEHGLFSEPGVTSSFSRVTSTWRSTIVSAGVSASSTKITHISFIEKGKGKPSTSGITVTTKVRRRPNGAIRNPQPFMQEFGMRPAPLADLEEEAATGRRSCFCGAGGD
jgi:hypothetical protein